MENISMNMYTEGNEEENNENENKEENNTNGNNNDDDSALNNPSSQGNDINIIENIKDEEDEEEDNGHDSSTNSNTNGADKKKTGYDQVNDKKIEKTDIRRKSEKMVNASMKTDDKLDGSNPRDTTGSNIDAEKASPNKRATMSNDKVIDFVLVYDVTEDEEEAGKVRSSYEEDLQDFGVEIEREVGVKDCFVKLHCPWDTLCRGAQLIKLKKPVNRKNIQPQTSEKWLGCIKRKETKVQVHQPFSIKEISSFVIDDEETFFSSAERHYILQSILEKTVFQADDKILTGIGSLLSENIYKAAYPLHDPLPTPPNHDESSMNEREYLLHAWARKRNLLHSQPLSHIREYFGEQFAFYFAWLEMYTAFLLIAALFGIAVTAYGVATLYVFPVLIDDTCDGTKFPGNFTLCPKCNQRCNYIQLSDTCNSAKLTQVFDNLGTLFYSIFICLWAICFCEMWKRRQSFLQYLWSVNDFEHNENVRPEYEKQATVKLKNPISGMDESFVPSSSVFLRRCLSFSMVFFLLVIVIITILAVLVYRLAISYALYQSSNTKIKNNAKIITTITAALINVFFITILSFIYKKLAKVLTDMEAHKTRSSYQDSFIFKIVVFQFINNYGSLIYIAFFKGSFVDSPGHNSMYVFGRYRQDECEASGCMSELTIQLMITMIGKQVLNAIFEMFIPFAAKHFRMRDNKVARYYLPWERDLDLSCLDVVPLYSEYLEMVVQYGFVVLFVAAFPLAPLFALINNLFEIHLDAYKLLKLFRRPAGLKAQDIGAWQGTILTFSQIAVVTNAFILAWTSDFIPRQVYKFENGGSLEGYIQHTFVSFNTSSFSLSKRPDFTIFPSAANVTQCMYRSYAIPSDQIETYYRSFFWHVLCARWAFVIVFEHTCFFIISMFGTIPDKSDNVKLIQEYEKTIHNQVAVNDLFERVRSRKSTLNIVSPFLTPTGFSSSRAP